MPIAIRRRAPSDEAQFSVGSVFGYVESPFDFLPTFATVFLLKLSKLMITNKNSVASVSSEVMF